MKLAHYLKGLLLCLVLNLGACATQQPPGEAESLDTSSVDDRRKPIDLIINGDYVVSMDADASVYQASAVAVHEGIILAIGSQAKISATYIATESLAGDGRIVMPGLINGHSHAAMTLLRGVADDLALMDWLNNYIFPAELEFVDSEFVRIGTELACWENIR